MSGAPPSGVTVGAGLGVGSVSGAEVGVTVGSAECRGRSTGAAVTSGVGEGVTAGVSSFGAHPQRVSSKAAIRMRCNGFIMVSLCCGIMGNTSPILRVFHRNPIGYCINFSTYKCI